MSLFAITLANKSGNYTYKCLCISSEDPMDTILQGKFTNYNHEDRDYPSVQSIKKVGYLPEPKPTIASLAVIHAREKKEEQAKPKHFIMKKFQNVKGAIP